MFFTSAEQKIQQLVRKHRKIVYPVLAAGVALLVLFVLLYSNFGVIRVVSFFRGTDPYADETVLFLGNGCDQCDKVDAFVRANKIGQKITFEELEVFDNKSNQNILQDKAQICALDPNQIGVPFLWIGPQRRCIIGYPDIISYFQMISKKAK